MVEALFILAAFIFVIKLVSLPFEVAEKRREEAAENIIAASIAAHSKTLFIKSEQLKVADPYGNVDYSKFLEHAGYFVTHVIARDLVAGGISKTYLAKKERVEKLLTRIAKAVSAEADKAAPESLENVKTGIDYEIHCKRLLEQCGWEVLTTPATGDQGADLIATKDSVRVIFQCKFYSQPVGNKAVQEAHAAKAFQKADFAIVVTNASYTTAAQQLAQTSGVLLIHHQQIPVLESLIGEQYFHKSGMGHEII